MPRWIASIIILSLVFNISAAWAFEVKITGYFPGGYTSKRQARIEGGKFDRYGRPLKTLQNYQHGSYVSCATDPKIIKSGTIFTIDKFPGIRFLACDVGRGVRGHHIDICVNTEAHAYQLPKKARLTKKEYVKISKNTKKARLKIESSD